MCKREREERAWKIIGLVLASKQSIQQPHWHLHFMVGTVRSGQSGIIDSNTTLRHFAALQSHMVFRLFNIRYLWLMEDLLLKVKSFTERNK